jgi:hypothetical protein
MPNSGLCCAYYYVLPYVYGQPDADLLVSMSNSMGPVLLDLSKDINLDARNPVF